MGKYFTAHTGQPVPTHPPTSSSFTLRLRVGEVPTARMHRAPPLVLIQITSRVRDARAQELLPHATTPPLTATPSFHSPFLADTG